jgi:death-on-curing protein
VSIEYVELVDYLAIAVEVTGLSVETITRVTKLDLADSALHAPSAGFGDTEFYPEFVDKAAVLLVRLAKTTRCRMGTSVPRGWHCDCSWGSTAGAGRQRRVSMTPNGPC